MSSSEVEKNPPIHLYQKQIYMPKEDKRLSLISKSKTELTKEDKRLSSISKSMTVDKLKTELTKNKIVYSTGKNKAYYVDLYISNGLHNKAVTSPPKSTRKSPPKSTRKSPPKKDDKSRQGRSSSSIRDDKPKPIIPNEKTIKTIKRIFSGKDINITNEIEIHISEKGEDCALFIIYPDHIYIEALHKCGTTTGNNLLEKFDILASEIPNMTYVRLDDDSNIQMCGREIKLYTLKILTTGQSWYNSKGYVSDNNDDQKTVNARIINMPYEEFRDKLSAQEATVIDTGNRLFPETKKKTVQDYFKYVLNDINRNIKEKGCGDEETIEKCRWLSTIINTINEMPYSIRYNQSGLVKEQLSGGAKIKRNKSKKNKKYQSLLHEKTKPKGGFV